MTDHPQQLYAVEFTEADQARLVGFSCGEEKWSQHFSEWILGSDVVESMKKGTRVWLFETAQSEVVGFGAIGKTRWQWPPPKGARATLVIIPMLGLDARFHGQPPDPAWRSSRQMMSHLFAEGQRLVHEWPGNLTERPQWMVLLVHQDNRRAIWFYEQCGFELIPNVVRRNDHLIMKIWIGESGAPST